MGDRLRVFFLCTLIFMLFIKFDIIMAGDCNCNPTYDAKAKVSDNCSTIWNSRSCTLKEVSKASQNEDEREEWVTKVLLNLRNIPPKFGWPRWTGLSDSPDFYSKILPEIRNMRYFEWLILFTLAGEVPPKFAANVIDGIRNSSSQVESAWEKDHKVRFKDERTGVQFILQKHIIYAKKENVAFYINLRREGPAPSF